MAALTRIAPETMHVAVSPAPHDAAGAKLFAAQATALPIEIIYCHIMPLVDRDVLRNTTTVSKTWRAEVRRLVDRPLIDKINVVTHGTDYERASAALAVVRSIRENLDVLREPERAKLATFVNGLPNDWDFVRALRAIGPGVRHFSVEQQNGLLDRAEQIARGEILDPEDPTAVADGHWLHNATMRLVPYLSEGPRQRAFNFSLDQKQPHLLKSALDGVREQSELMSESELDAAVNKVTDPDDLFFTMHEAYRADAVETLGRGKGLSSRHRDRLFQTAQTFAHEEDVSRACAGILDGASLTASPHWPGMERLEELAARADRMTTPENKARLMAAICSAADEHAPQRAVDVLKGLTAPPQNEELQKYLFNNLDALQVSPTATMSETDREYVIARLLDYNPNPANPHVALARNYAIAKTLGQLDFLSSAEIDKRLYDAAVNLPDEHGRALAIGAAARRIAEQMRGAKPEDHAKLAIRASDLVDRALNLGNPAFCTSLPGLKAVLPGISDQQKENLVAHVLALPQDGLLRMPAIGLLLQSRAALGENRINRLLDGTGINATEI